MLDSKLWDGNEVTRGCQVSWAQWIPFPGSVPRHSTDRVVERGRGTWGCHFHPERCLGAPEALKPEGWRPEGGVRGQVPISENHKLTGAVDKCLGEGPWDVPLSIVSLALSALPQDK